MSGTPKTIKDVHVYPSMQECMNTMYAKLQQKNIDRLEQEIAAAQAHIKELEQTNGTLHRLMASGEKRGVEKATEELTTRIKRLVEAGDEMASAWDKEWLTEADIEAIIDDWHGAKEGL
jgi:mevalonate kinase